MAQVDPYVTRPATADEDTLRHVIHYAESAAVRRGMTPADAQDIAQEVVLKYWRLWDTVRSKRWQPWVARVVTTTTADYTSSSYFRHWSATVPLHLVGAKDAEGRIRVGERQLGAVADIADEVAERLTPAPVVVEMQRLSDAPRRAFIASANGYTMREIAEREGVPEGTIKSALFRVRRSLRKRLAV